MNNCKEMIYKLDFSKSNIKKDYVRMNTNKEKINSKLETYCDNMLLAKKIINCKPCEPVEFGLYIHELLMLKYVSYGNYNNSKDNRFSKTWKYQYHVLCPELLLQSLQIRKYVKECSLEEMLDFMKYHELKKLLNDFGIKPLNSKENCKQIIRKKISMTDLGSYLKNYRYYILSEKGKVIINQNKNLQINVADIWLTKEIQGNSGITESNLNIIDILSRDLYFNKKGLIKEIIHGTEYSSKYAYKRKEDDFKLYIYYNDKLVRTETEINSYKVLNNINVLQMIKYNDNKILGINYNYNNDFILGQNEISTDLCYDNYFDSLIINSKKKFNNTSNFIFYCSYESEYVHYILKKLSSKGLKIKKMNFLKNLNYSDNYMIDISNCDSNIINYIYYLFLNKLLFGPKLMNISLYDFLLFCYYVNEKCLTYQLIIKNYIKTISEYDKIIRFIEHYKSDYLVNYIYKNYSYDSVFLAKINRYPQIPWTTFNIIKENGKLMHKKILTELKEENFIPTKWKSEFELFLLIRSYFDDSIFQYRDTWLENQSIDIYIPSLKLGIEYQGKQHYEAVEFFGGKEGFEKNVKRDKKKAKKCKENNIKLIYWKYDEKIILNTLVEKLSRLDILIPLEKQSLESIVCINKKETIKTTPKQRKTSYNVKNRKYDLYDINGNFIKGFTKVKDAADFIGCNPNKLSDVLHGRRNQYRGYILKQIK